MTLSPDVRTKLIKAVGRFVERMQPVVQEHVEKTYINGRLHTAMQVGAQPTLSAYDRYVVSALVAKHMNRIRLLGDKWLVKVQEVGTKVAKAEEGPSDALSDQDWETIWGEDPQPGTDEWQAAMEAQQANLDAAANASAVEAQASGADATYAETGVDGIVAVANEDACEVCTPHDGDPGPVDSSAEDSPPFHTNCECGDAPDTPTLQEMFDAIPTLQTMEDALFDDVKGLDPLNQWKEDFGVPGREFSDFVERWTHSSTEIRSDFLDKSPSDWRPYTQQLANYMDHATSVEQTVYRGSGWSGAFPSEGGNVSLAPSSFSRDIDVARNFADEAAMGSDQQVLFNVENARGVPLDGLSNFPEEEEVIVGGNFTVTNVDVVEDEFQRIAYVTLRQE